MINHATYLNIAIPTPLRQTFHYLPPAGVNGNDLLPGIRLKVPFGRRQVIGILISVDDDAGIDAARIKPAISVLDQQPVIPPATMRLCIWAAAYYHHPIGEVMATALPALLRQGESPGQVEESLIATAAGMQVEMATLKRAPAQSGLLRKLREAVSGLSRARLNDLEFSRATVKTLVGKQLASWHSRPYTPPDPFDPAAIQMRAPLILTSEQQSAIQQVIAGGARTTLLYGVTGSGKTEVYLQLIAAELRAGRQSLVLVPEIGLTPQAIRRFTDRFDVPVCLLHSGLGDKDRLEAWQAARTGACGIVLGTRSAIYTPLLKPGLIIVDEEHDGSFKQQDGLRYSARDLAVMRGQISGIPVVLGSATPSLESWHNANIGKYDRTPLTIRPGGAMHATYRVLDLRNQPLVEGFSEPLLASIHSHLGAGNQVLVFLNRRGFSPVLICRQCGWIAQCHRCDARLTVHQANRSLVCHHCGSQHRIATRCPACESGELAPLGSGTERLEQALAGLFENYPIIRIDRDSTRNRHAMERQLARINEGEPAILVGTQILAKGHHFPNVTLVAIVDMDAGFYSANYKAAEQMGQLILQVGGRAGRAEKPGVVAIQTHLPDQPIFRRLIEDGYARFADELLKDRQLHELPPFHHHGLLRADATNNSLPMHFLNYIAQQFEPGPSVVVLGPAPASMERRAGRFRAQLLLSSPARKPLATALSQCIRIAESAPDVRKVRWSVDVDPVDLF